MTLIIGGGEGSITWMCSDAAISDPVADTRNRLYRPKIEIVSSSALLGFAGPLHLGSEALAAISPLDQGAGVSEVLLRLHRRNPAVQFLYSFLENGNPRLVRIANGNIEHSASFFIGDQNAYEAFQEIRLSLQKDHAPDAIHRLILAGFGDQAVPRALEDAINAMLKQFAASGNSAVGGWAAPFVHTPSGPSMCAYSYSVTDPVVPMLETGQEIPHGTAEGGGYSFSFCPLRELDGIVVYWLQRPGGKVFIREGTGYQEYNFYGPPDEFKKDVFAKLGRTVDIWFAGTAVGPPTSVDVLRDEYGDPRMFVARHGNELSFSWANNPNGSFISHKAFDISDGGVNPNNSILGGRKLDVSVSKDSQTACLSTPELELKLTAIEVDALISALSNARQQLLPPVPFEIAPDTKLEAILNPAWRTRPPPHKSVPGPLLVLRHPGHGWQPFILPRDEAKALGEWLSNYISQTNNS